MNLEEFHKAHGPAWARISSFSSFSQGLIFLSVQHMEMVKNLTDHEITTNAVTILSELRGRLRMEAELLALATMVEPTPTAPLSEEYPNSEEEAYLEDQRRKNTRPV